MPEKDTGNQSQPPQPVEVFFKIKASDPNRFSAPPRQSLRTQGLIGGLSLAGRQPRVEIVPPEPGVEPEPDIEVIDE